MHASLHVYVWTIVLFYHKNSRKVIDKYYLANFIIILLQQIIITNYYVKSID